jgi:hypothetical protein
VFIYDGNSMVVVSSDAPRALSWPHPPMHRPIDRTHTYVVSITITVTVTVTITIICIDIIINPSIDHATV